MYMKDMTICVVGDQNPIGIQTLISDPKSSTKSWNEMKVIDLDELHYTHTWQLASTHQ